METLVEKLSSLPEEKQDEYAASYLAQLEDGERWDKLFADPRSHEALSQTAEEARRAYEAGETEPLEELFKTERLKAVPHHAKISEAAGRSSTGGAGARDKKFSALG